MQNSHIEKGNRVIKSDSGLFYVRMADEVVKCKARSKLKKDSVIVGDFVKLSNSGSEYVIEDILPRKNRLIRPSLANIDQMIVMIAAVPEPDFMLVDKLLINAARQNIDVIICINKSDISLKSQAAIERDYEKSVLKIIRASAISGEVSALLPLLKDKLSGIAGQSAVGKSTIINALLGGERQKTGELSEKIQRGKNTTTASEIFEVGGGYVVDTPGFSVLDIFDVLPEDVSHYYEEFNEARASCKFSTCLHIAEPSCAVIAAVEANQISSDRYNRYKKIYFENKDFYDRNPSLRPKN